MTIKTNSISIEEAEDFENPQYYPYQDFTMKRKVGENFGSFREQKSFTDFTLRWKRTEF